MPKELVKFFSEIEIDAAELFSGKLERMSGNIADTWRTSQIPCGLRQVTLESLLALVSSSSPPWSELSSENPVGIRTTIPPFI